MNLNLVSSSSSKLRLRLRLRLSFIIGRVGTLGGRAGNPGGQGWGPLYHPVHAISRPAGLFKFQCTQCSPVHTSKPLRVGTTTTT